MEKTINGTFEKELIFENGAVAKVSISYRDVSSKDAIAVTTGIKKLASEIIEDISSSK